MKDGRVDLNPNLLVQHLDKRPEDFTKADIIKFIRDKGIQCVNFRYVGGDGKLKTLNFVVNNREQLDLLLSVGERVDGSSLFSYIDAGASDLYVVPRYKTAFVNPFAPIPTVDFLCSYYTNQGLPLPSAPENVVRKAHEVLKEKTGMELEALGELEYYVLFDKRSLYPATPQRSYHECAPFGKWEDMRREAMLAIAQTGGQVKYGHSEVGHIYEGSREFEQHEIEFSPAPLEDAADQLVVAKWIMRMIGHKYGVEISYAPKIIVGHAGSGLHIHTRLMKDGKNAMVDGNGLNDNARKVIGGYLKLATSLTAFGNTTPVSFLRLVPHQEAPTNVCWGDRNRSVLVRVPLGWQNVENMVGHANRQGGNGSVEASDKQTVEFRCPDGSANVHYLLAGMAVAARHGLQAKDTLDLAKKLYVDVNIFHDEHKNVQEKLPQLPASCWDSADNLIRDRKIYEEYDVFSPATIDGISRELRRFEDKDMSEKLYGKTEKIKELVDTHFHCA